jgi:hypothetical protein
MPFRTGAPSRLSVFRSSIIQGKFAPRFLLVKRLDLRGMCEQVIIAVVRAAVIAFTGLILAANPRPRFVDRAPIVSAQMLARRLNLNVPITIFDKNRDTLMHQVPPQIVEIPHRLRLIDRQRQVTTARSRTMFAQYGTHIGVDPSLIYYDTPGRNRPNGTPCQTDACTG